jgi:hypothetical protein
VPRHKIPRFSESAFVEILERFIKVLVNGSDNLAVILSWISAEGQ